MIQAAEKNSLLFYYCFFLTFPFSVLGWVELRKMIRLFLHEKIEGWEYEALGYSTVVDCREYVDGAGVAHA